MSVSHYCLQALFAATYPPADQMKRIEVMNLQSARTML